MNWEDKDIDDLFREAADSAQFEYNDAYFEAIDAQLPLRKRRALWIWFSVLIVALTAGGLWIFTETTLPVDEKQISKTDKENLTESQVSAKETSAANEQVENDRDADRRHRRVARLAGLPSGRRCLIGDRNVIEERCRERTDPWKR